MNYYKKSDGERISKSEIDRRVRIAKAEKLQEQRNEFGYNFCEEKGCGRSDGYIDCSHDKSVNDCQREGMSELAYDKNNITIRCRDCHIIWDSKY